LQKFSTWLIAVPLYILIVDDYVLTTSEAIYENGFLSLTTSKTLFSDATSAKIYATSLSQCRKGGCDRYLAPHFEVYFPDGSSHDIWGSLKIDFNDQPNLLKDVTHLKNLGIPISVEPLSSYDEEVLKLHNLKSQQFVHQIFEEAAEP
jgi:hypothetical protein